MRSGSKVVDIGDRSPEEPPMTGPRSASYYADLERRLRALDPLVVELVPDLADWYREYLDVGEYGLALEIVAERLTPRMPQDRVRLLAAGLLPEAKLMEVPDAVIDALQELT
jgi:hypothetical protein